MFKKKKEAGINHRLVTFLDHSFGSQDVSGQVVHGLGGCSSCPGETT